MIDNRTYSIDPQYRTGSIPVQALHVLLERLMKDWIQDYRQGIPIPPRHPSFLLAYYKGFQVKHRLTNHSPRGKALCLLKTQFAKKPKNPV